MKTIQEAIKKAYRFTFDSKDRSELEAVRKQIEDLARQERVVKEKIRGLEKPAQAARWARVGRFFKAVGAAIITIPARIPLIFIPVWEVPGYCEGQTMAATDDTASGEASPETQEPASGMAVMDAQDGTRENPENPRIQEYYAGQDLDEQCSKPTF